MTRGFLFIFNSLKSNYCRWDNFVLARSAVPSKIWLSNFMKLSWLNNSASSSIVHGVPWGMCRWILFLFMIFFPILSSSVALSQYTGDFLFWNGIPINGIVFEISIHLILDLSVGFDSDRMNLWVSLCFSIISSVFINWSWVLLSDNSASRRHWFQCLCLNVCALFLVSLRCLVTCLKFILIIFILVDVLLCCMIVFDMLYDCIRDIMLLIVALAIGLVFNFVLT